MVAGEEVRETGELGPTECTDVIGGKGVTGVGLVDEEGGGRPSSEGIVYVYVQVHVGRGRT